MSKSDWVTSGVVCDNLAISLDHLTRLRKDGVLKFKRHWINIARPIAVRPTYRYHLKRCQEAIEKMGEG